jgi:hypothetical protein
MPGNVVFRTSLLSVNAHASAMSPCVVGRLACTELIRVWSVAIFSYGAIVTCEYALA